MAKYNFYIDSQIPYVGEIPAHWKTVPNKRVMHKEKRICDSYAGQDIISLTMKGAIVRDLGAGGKMPTTFDGYQFVYPGELLMCLFDIDVTPRCVGRVYSEGLTSPAYSSFVLHDNADLGYFYYYYLMLDHTKELLHLAKNLRHSLTEEQLGQIKVPVPPLEEQRKIAAYLDNKIEGIDSIIAEAKASIEEYKEMKASLVHEAVTKGVSANAILEETKVEWIGMMPSNWDKAKLKLMVKHKTVRADSNENYIGLENVESGSGRFVPSKKDNFAAEGVSLAVSKGDIIFGKLRPYLAKCAIVEIDGSCSSEFIVMETFACDPRYIKYIMLSPKFVDTINMTTYGAKMPRANWETIGNMIIPMPTMETQSMICDYLDIQTTRIDGMASEKMALIADLEAYKKSLIFEVVTGKRKVV